MELMTEEVKIKKLIKEAFVELVQERREMFIELIVEALEDIGLVEAIREGRQNEFVSEEADIDPLLQLAGVFESHHSDIGETHESYIGESVKT